MREELRDEICGGGGAGELETDVLGSWGAGVGARVQEHLMYVQLEK